MSSFTKLPDTPKLNIDYLFHIFNINMINEEDPKGDYLYIDDRLCV